MRTVWLNFLLDLLKGSVLFQELERKSFLFCFLIMFFVGSPKYYKKAFPLEKEDAEKVKNLLFIGFSVFQTEMRTNMKVTIFA